MYFTNLLPFPVLELNDFDLYECDNKHRKRIRVTANEKDF